MQTKDTNITVLLLFSFFVIISYSSFISIFASGWRFEPINKSLRNVVVGNKQEKVLGVSVKNDSNSYYEKRINLLDQKAYMFDNNIIEVNGLVIFETTEASEIKLNNNALIKGIKINKNPECKLVGINLSYDNKQSWVYWDGVGWEKNEENSLDKFMASEFFENIKQTDYILNNGFLPGISENLHFRLALNSKTCSFIEASVSFKR